MNRKKTNLTPQLIIVFIVLYFTVLFCLPLNKINNSTSSFFSKEAISETYSSTLNETCNEKREKINGSIVYDIPPYSDKPFVSLNNNIPFFNDSEKIVSVIEEYSDLDNMGRCGVALACISVETMPTEERGEIGNIKPTGWHTIKYDIVDGKYLYNRCHLIGYQLAGENANPQNLLTGTRYLNTEGMLQFENIVAEYVKETNNHVLYRVTPVFVEKNLLANGVILEAYSIEDNGIGVCFNVFCYNVQPGIKINYATGDSALLLSPTDSSATQTFCYNNCYITNKNTKKFHHSYCSSVQDIKDKNKGIFNGERRELIELGFSPCKRCNP